MLHEKLKSAEELLKNLQDFECVKDLKCYFGEFIGIEITFRHYEFKFDQLNYPLKTNKIEFRSIFYGTKKNYANCVNDRIEFKKHISYKIQKSLIDIHENGRLNQFFFCNFKICGGS